MASRLELNALLAAALGSSNVYFQPPESVRMHYPCIVYKLNSDDVNYANNRVYRKAKRYDVTVIDRNPDSAIPDRVAAAFNGKIDRCYTADNLNHYSITIYY